MYVANEKEHNKNMAAIRERAKTKDATPKPSKSTTCEPEVKWFGRVFSGSGASADPDKIQHIVQAGKPETIEDVRSLLQAAAHNAKYGFNHKEDQSYEEVTGPLLVGIKRFENYKNFENFKDGNNTNKMGLMKVKGDKQRNKEGFKPRQPAKHQEAHHDQEGLEAHPTKLKKEGKIEKMNPAEAVAGILKPATSKDKQAGTATDGIETDTRTSGDHKQGGQGCTTKTKATKTDTRTSGDHELHQDNNTTKTKATEGIETTETDTGTSGNHELHQGKNTTETKATDGIETDNRTGSKPTPGTAATASKAATGGVEGGGGGGQKGAGETR